MSKSVQKLRERILKRAELRDNFSALAEEDQREIESIQKELRDTGRNMTQKYLMVMKLRIELIFRKLAKVLPDERVVEHDIGDNLVSMMTDDELDAEISRYLPKGTASGAVEGEEREGAETTH